MSGRALLVLQEGSEVHRIEAAAVVLGRSEGCDVSFDRKGVSRRHCEVILRTNGLIVRDLGSTHGTLVDGSRIAGEAMAQRGAVLRLGSRGPRIRIIDARLDGRSIPHSTGDAEATRDAGPVERTVIMQRPAPGGAPPPIALAGPMDASQPRSIFGRGLLLGLLVGAGAGAGALLLLEPGVWIHAAREAIDSLR